MKRRREVRGNREGEDEGKGKGNRKRKENERGIEGKRKGIEWGLKKGKFPALQ